MPAKALPVAGKQDDGKPKQHLVVIYGQDVLYAARGQDARSRPAKAGIQEGGPGCDMSDSPA